MKQLVQNMRDGVTEIVEIPVPKARPGTALVKTAVSLVSSGTERMLAEFAEMNLLDKARSRPDLVKQVLEKAQREGILPTIGSVFNRLDQPMSLGYSSAGTIIDLGEGMNGFQVGDRVSCSGSGYAVHAEYAIVPKNLLTKIPDSVDFESAAFTTVGAIALHGFRLAETQIGERVAVIGLGLLGMISVQIARASGCTVFGVDLDPHRVALCSSLGIKASTRADALSDGISFSQGEGFDAVLICADTQSNDPIELAGSLASQRARIVAVGAVGLDIPRKVYYEKELTILVSRSYGPGRYDPNYEEKGIDYPLGYVRWTEGRNFVSFLDLVADQKVNLMPLVTHRYPIETGMDAYELIKNKSSEKYLGVLIGYTMADQQAGQPKRIPFTHSLKSRPGSDRVRIGVLGAGNYANAVFLPAIKSHKQTELTAIVSASGLSAQQSGKKFNFQYVTTDEEELFKDSNIDAIVVLTRHHLHGKQIMSALKSGKHVFCEKPLTIFEKELDDLRSVIEDSKSLQFTLGFNRRFSPFIASIQQQLSNRNEPVFMNCRVNAGFLPKNHWLHDPLQGGGRLIGEGCHFIDLCSHIVGMPPSSGTAAAMADHGKYFQDNLAITLEYTDGSIATVQYLSNGSKIQSKEYIEIYCGGKVFVVDDFRSLSMYSEKNKKVIRSQLRQEKGRREIWSEFINSILEGNKPIIPYEHIWGVTKTTFCIMDSIQSGNRFSVPPY